MKVTDLSRITNKLIREGKGDYSIVTNNWSSGDINNSYKLSDVKDFKVDDMFKSLCLRNYLYKENKITITEKDDYNGYQE